MADSSVLRHTLGTVKTVRLCISTQSLSGTNVAAGPAETDNDIGVPTADMSSKSNSHNDHKEW